MTLTHEQRKKVVAAAAAATVSAAIAVVAVVIEEGYLHESESDEDFDRVIEEEDYEDSDRFDEDEDYHSDRSFTLAMEDKYDAEARRVAAAYDAEYDFDHIADQYLDERARNGGTFEDEQPEVKIEAPTKVVQKKRKATTDESEAEVKQEHQEFEEASPFLSARRKKNKHEDVVGPTSDPEPLNNLKAEQIHLDDLYYKVLPKYTVPDHLLELDEFRYLTLPLTMEIRGNDKYLTKEEVVKLVEWKLKHGTFRPSLLNLVQSNSASTVESVTRHAFSLLPSFVGTGNSIYTQVDPLPALKHLILLAGIGPATASLILSVGMPSHVPFFSDELFRWLMWDEPANPWGWKRQIRYTVKEYAMLAEKAQILRKQICEQDETNLVNMKDFEQAAYVMGKQQWDLGVPTFKEKEMAAKAVKKKDDGKKTTAQSGSKRKADEDITQPRSTRRSTRRTLKY